MTLSNTATPIYYGRFREKVIRGENPVYDITSMTKDSVITT